MQGRDDVTTAAELENMTPAERHADFESRVITDSSKVPPAFQAQVRDDLEEWLARQSARRAS